MRRTALFMLSIVVMLAFINCSDSGTNNENPNPIPQYTIGDLTAADYELLEAGADFAPDIFREVVSVSGSDENVFISPLSISMAMGMAHAGAAGGTQDGIHEGLRLPDGMTLEQINKSYRSIMTVLPGLDPATTVSLANAVWYRQGLSLHGSFESTCRDYFDAQVKAMDFNLPTAADTINDWVDEKTNGKIDGIVKPPLSPNLMAILANAIYFKGTWTYTFDPDMTESLPFHRADGTEVLRDMMRLCTDSLRDASTGEPDTTVLYARTELFKAASLPYGNTALRMTVLAPNQDYDAGDIIETFTADSWDEWRNQLEPAFFDVVLPKFRFEFGQMLNDHLIAMGMEDAFNPAVANFDSMFVDLSVYISKVLHKSFVQVDEEGTEAAAVTAVFMDATSIEKPVVACNRPFVFVIHESTTGAILFMGRIADPVWED